MTLLARDEADVVDAQIAFHLHAGCRLRDRDRQRLERRDDGDPRAVRARGPPAAPPRAGRRHAPGRVGHAHGAPRGHRARRRLGDQLRRGRVLVAARRVAEGRPRGRAGRATASFAGCWRHFLPRPDDGSFFAERMTVRLAAPAHPGARRRSSTPIRRSRTARIPTSRSSAGTTTPTAPGLLPLRAWHPIEVLHFSFRSVEQVERKGRGGGWLRNPRPTHEPTLHQILLAEAQRDGRIDEPSTTALAVDDEALARGLADGTLAIDTRLRDALRALRDDDGTLRPARRRADRSRSPGPTRRRGRGVRSGGVRARRRSTASSAPSSACARSSGGSARSSEAPLRAARRLARR